LKSSKFGQCLKDLVLLITQFKEQHGISKRSSR
jgi:hypothetical protein